jgi:hypothetical protein
VEVTASASPRRAFEGREFSARRFQHLNSPEWTSLWDDTRFQKLVDRLAENGATDNTTLNLIVDTPLFIKSIFVIERMFTVSERVFNVTRSLEVMSRNSSVSVTTRFVEFVDAGS